MDRRINKKFKIKQYILILIFAFSPWLEAKTISFSEAVDILDKHDSIESIRYQAKASSEEADLNASWGDPSFKLAAVNLPKDSLKKEESAMAGIQFGLSQKIALSTKYGNIHKSFSSLANAYQYKAEDKKQALSKSLWEILIFQKKIKKELAILNENKTWINKILKVSKRLYATGKTSQQAILEIQIRKTEIESDINNKNYELLQIADKLDYLIGAPTIEESTVPWHFLTINSNQSKDYKELDLKEKLKASNYNLTASKLNYIPDVTLSLTYTKRSNIYDDGDFVGAGLSFPIPVSAKKYSKHSLAAAKKYVAVKNLATYKKQKKRNLAILNKDIKMLEEEILLLEKKTIQFATNSRKITSKSYGLGNSTYIELLQSELKLQKILMRKITLEAKRDIKKVELKYLMGEPLNA